ncbi:MAG: hypothetical protein IPN91_02110 [Holophagaceae bacterium]|uniref:Uncharacterized protein n=1 Tax=Candidatus Geothrix odensensis TaxID=2954440 RepID=A0A936EZZ9_9BACT|nr:hypothetical protein [Candidatus Geothrix odensensis]
MKHVPRLLGEEGLKPHRQDRHPLALLPGGAAGEHGPQMVEQLLDGVAGGDEAIALDLLQGPEVLLRRRVVEDEEDGEVVEEDPGLPAQKAAETVAIHGITAGVDEEDLGLAPGVLRQGLEGIRGLQDAMPSPLERHPQAFNEVVMAGDHQQVHEGPK